METIKIRFKDDILRRKNRFINEMFDQKSTFRDKEVIYSTPSGQVHLLASGTPIINEAGIVNSGLIILRPIKEIHRLVNRFSGAKATFRFEDIITGNEAMQELIGNAKMAAFSMSTILIEGESGTGKELFAQAIHNHSRRSKGPFIALNCGAIPRDLIGSELFGYVEGAFTGARKGGNPGKFELASGGTLFLDEIGDMPFEQQVALLRVIQEKSITRIGGSQVISIDVRIICATNKDLHIEMNGERFRKDLYYRLNVISIKIPPLRERKEDIIFLMNHFLKNAYAYWKNDSSYLAPELLQSLQAYNWPGNIRELQNVVERMLNTAKGSKLSVAHLPTELFSNILNKQVMEEKSLYITVEDGKTIHEARASNKQFMEAEERRQIIQLLQRCKGNVSQVAREMGISRTTLYKRMLKYRVDE